MTKWIYDWPQIIRDLQADAYTAAGKRDVLNAASSWIVCACGNLCDEIPRAGSGRPLDDDLFNAGIDFSDAIRKMCRSATVHEREIHAINARYYLFRINRREAELLEGNG